MSAIVEALELLVGDAPSGPLSLAVDAGEIVSLLFPSSRPRTPVLRALAGVDAPSAGEVRFPRPGRVVLATQGMSLSDVLASRPDLVLVDAANDALDRRAWARIAAERAGGTSFIIATASVDEAYRADRVSLVAWELAELTRAIQELARRMNSDVQEFLAVLEESQHGRTAPLASELRRLNAGARALLAEMRRRAHAVEDRLALQNAAAQVAVASVDENVLETVIAQAIDK